MYPALVATPPESGSLSVNSGVPVPFGLLYSLNITVPVGFSPPLTVALSATELPAVAVAGCWAVAIAGVAAVTVIVPEVPVTELVVVSVTVTVWGPVVTKLTKLVKVWVPLSPEVKV